MSVNYNKETGTHTFACERNGCGFESRGWVTESQAETRGDQHYGEHDGKGLMQELVEFESQVGFERSE